MRYRMMATYRGVPYEAGVGPYGSDVVLFAACPPPEELGFEPATGHWRKRVIRAEVDALWESRPVGSFRDEPCMVLDDLGDRLHIAYLGGNPERAASLGYWQVDRGVFELLTPREEVTGLTEERVDKPLLSTLPPTAASLDTSYPYHPAPLPPAPPAPPPPANPLPPPANPLPPMSAPLPPMSAPLPPMSAPPAVPLAPVAAAAPPLPAAPPSIVADPLLAPAPPSVSPGSLLPPVTASPPRSASPPRQRATRAAHSLDPPTGDPGGRAARRQRVPTRDIFSDLADLAAIPRSAYALETEADGALCLVPTPEGFEVFVAMDGARHEARSFSDEEAAYFYLFGVLAAEAIRNGTLVPSATPAGVRHDLS